MSNCRDPIHQNDDGKWYFWDETWSFEEGPYDTKEQARDTLSIYYENLTQGEQ